MADSLDINENTLRKNICFQLDKLGIPVNYRGYEYLATAIERVYLARYGERTDFIKYIYPLIAKEFTTSVSCVERAIRGAINSAWEDDPERFISSLSISHRPKSGELIIKIKHIIKYF